jgi:hypothetical protein
MAERVVLLVVSSMSDQCRPGSTDHSATSVWAAPIDH